MLPGITQVTVDGYDPLDVLPPAARRKLEAMQDAAHMRHAALLLASDKKTAAHREHFEAERRLQHLLGTPHAVDRHGNEHPAIVEQRAKVNRLKAILDRSTLAHDVAEGEWRALKHPEHRCTEYVERSLRGARVQMAPAVEARLLKGEATKDAVERVRGEIAALNAELKRIERAPHPSGEVMASMTAMVDALAKHGRPDVKPSVHNAESPRWPETAVHTYRGLRAEGGAMQQDAVALLAWMFPDAMKAALAREVAAVAQDDVAVPAADRPGLLADLLAKRRHTERVEESLIEMAAAEGVMISRREEADPRCILGLSDAAPDPGGR